MPATDIPESAGLCSQCRHARLIVSDKGHAFIRCGRSDSEPSYDRYPRLPVLECAGVEPDPPPLP
jgi:hypothetical protein